MTRKRMRPTFLVVLTVVALVVLPGAAAGTDAGGGPLGLEAEIGPSSPVDSQSSDPGQSSVDQPTSSPSTEGHDACEAVAGTGQRDNPENDTLGWENGCWYDDPIDVTVEDGLNDTELSAVVGRTMARIEHIRELEFEETVPVEVITREEYAEQTAGAFANTSESDRLHQNAKYEALFFVGEDSDALAQMQTNRAGSVLGYYSPTRNRIIVISDDAETLKLGELTLAHELVHAVQDQQFNISEYNRSTTEQDKATLGLIEGDAHYTEKLYENRCDANWECPSIDQSSPDLPDGFHWGMYFISYQPYSDGPRFVETVRDDGGWTAVDDVYDDPPASSEQVISPEKYPDERPTEVTVADRSNDQWRVPDTAGGVNYAEFGQVGLSTMFVYPSYEGSEQFVSIQEFRNSGPSSDLDPLNYSNEYTDGWAGDRFYPYVTNSSAQTNETGYVWKTVWDTEADAQTFTEAYVELLAFHGADSVDGRTDTYRIPDENGFGDAFYVTRNGETVVIVNAPSVEELDGVRAGAAPEVPATPSTSSNDVGPQRTDDTTVAQPPATTAAPGVGAVLAVAATVIVAFAIRRR